MDASWATDSDVDLLTPSWLVGKNMHYWGAACSSPCLLFTECRMKLDQHICPRVFWSCFAAKLSRPSFSQTQNDAGSAEKPACPAWNPLALWQSWVLFCLASAWAGQAKLTGGITVLKCMMQISQQEAHSHTGATSGCLMWYRCLHSGKHPCHWAGYLVHFLETTCGISLERSAGFQFSFSLTPSWCPTTSWWRPDMGLEFTDCMACCHEFARRRQCYWFRC